VPVKSRGSKISRAEAVAPLFEADRVLFPALGLPWRDELIEESAGFPTAKHDDMVDALVFAHERLRGVGGSVAGATVGGELRQAVASIAIKDHLDLGGRRSCSRSSSCSLPCPA
jgi:hypothetical protein